MAGDRPTLNDPEFAPAGDVRPLRALFVPFGLRRDDEAAWRDIARLAPAIARAYKFRSTVPAPKARETAQQLERLEAAAAALKEALGALGAPAMDWLLGYEPDAALYRTRGLADRGPNDTEDAFDALVDSVFVSELAAYRSRADTQLSAALSAAEADLSDFRRLEAAGSRLLAARERFRAVTHETLQEADAELEAAQREYDLAQVFVRPVSAPPPYEIIEAATRRVADLARLANCAQRHVAREWPEFRRGAKGDLVDQLPGGWLGTACCEVIAVILGPKAVRKISSARDGPFHELLRGFHKFAFGRSPVIPTIGEDRGSSTFAMALEAAPAWRDAMLAKWGLNPADVPRRGRPRRDPKGGKSG